MSGQEKKKQSSKSGLQSSKPSQKRYTAERRWERNRQRRMKRHIKKFPADLQAKRLMTDTP